MEGLMMSACYLINGRAFAAPMKNHQILNFGNKWINLTTVAFLEYTEGFIPPPRDLNEPQDPLSMFNPGPGSRPARLVVNYGTGVQVQFEGEDAERLKKHLDALPPA